MGPQDILDFWFEDLTPQQWYIMDDALDLRITEKYIALHSLIVAGEYAFWRNKPIGRLAEIIVIDQFSRNIYRDDPKSFVNDPMALALAQECIRGKYHTQFSPIFRQFIYMPFMNSESRIVHDTALLLFSEAGLEDNLALERQCRDQIKRFGRYPVRNKILGRESTPIEIDYLQKIDSFRLCKDSWQSISIQQEKFSPD